MAPVAFLKTLQSASIIFFRKISIVPVVVIAAVLTFPLILRGEQEAVQHAPKDSSQSVVHTEGVSITPLDINYDDAENRSSPVGVQDTIDASVMCISLFIGLLLFAIAIKRRQRYMIALSLFFLLIAIGLFLRAVLFYAG